MSKFTNEDRNRNYGLRVGDTVTYKQHHYINGKFETKESKLHEVVELGCGDNNAVYIREAGSKDKPFKQVAEWCDIKTKIEDQ